MVQMYMNMKRTLDRCSDISECRDELNGKVKMWGEKVEMKYKVILATEKSLKLRSKFQLVLLTEE